MEFSPEAQARFTTTIAKYPHKQAALLPCLWIAQEEHGHISVEDMAYIAKLLEIHPSHVLGVVGFYSMYQTEPVGKYHIQVCRTLSCELAGSEAIAERFCERLKIKPGETTPDGKFTLTLVECLASCGTGPMCQVNREYHENLTPDKVDALISQLVEAE